MSQACRSSALPFYSATVTRLDRNALASALLVAALLTALFLLSVAVHLGWVAGLDASVASWFHTHRTVTLRPIVHALFRFVGPGPVSVVGIVCGLLLSLASRSLVPVTIVVAAVGGAAISEILIKRVVVRAPWTAAELQQISHPLLRDGNHSFPSGHVAGNVALLGIVALYIGIGRGGAALTALAASTVAGVTGIDFIVLYVDAHCFSDVLGGMVLGALFVAAVGGTWVRLCGPPDAHVERTGRHRQRLARRLQSKSGGLVTPSRADLV